MRTGIIHGLATLLLIGLTSLGADEPKTNVAAQVVVPNLLDDKTKIGIGDILSFRIVEDRDQARNLAVSDSGELDIPYVGRVKAVDKTCRQIAGEVKLLLEKDYYHTATPLLAIDRVGARNLAQVQVQGAVGRPGFVDIPPGEKPKISKIIQSAGGMSSQAKRVVKVTRKKQGGGVDIIQVDMRAILDDGKTDRDIEIEAGDHIYVEQRIINFR